MDFGVISTSSSSPMYSRASSRVSGRAGVGGDHAAVGAGLEVAGPRGVAVEDVAHNALSLRHGEELGAEAEERPGRNLELYAGARALRLHVHELALAAGERADDRRGEPLGHVEDEMLERLVLFALDLPHDDPRRPYLNLVPLAPHGLEQDGEVQLAAPGDLELLGAKLLYAQRDVRLDLAHQAVAEVTAGYVP